MTDATGEKRQPVMTRSECPACGVGRVGPRCMECGSTEPPVKSTYVFAGTELSESGLVAARRLGESLAATERTTGGIDP